MCRFIFLCLRTQLFKLDWVIMSIVILCIIAMLLYGILNLVEKHCLKRR